VDTIYLRGENKGKKEIQEILEKLETEEELGSLNVDQVKEMLDLKLEMFDILDEEELY
jgi:hypothetical protein